MYLVRFRKAAGDGKRSQLEPSSSSLATDAPLSQAAVTGADVSPALLQPEPAVSSSSPAGFSGQVRHAEKRGVEKDVSSLSKCVQTVLAVLSETSAQTDEPAVVDGQCQTDCATLKSLSVQTDSRVLRSSRVQTTLPSLSSQRVQTVSASVQEASTQSVFTPVDSKSVQTASPDQELQSKDPAQLSISDTPVRGADITAEATAAQSGKETTISARSAAASAADYAQSHGAELPLTHAGQPVRPVTVKGQHSSEPVSGRSECDRDRSSTPRRAVADLRSNSVDGPLESSTPVSVRPVPGAGGVSYLEPALGPGPAAPALNVEGLGMISSNKSGGSFYSLHTAPPESSLAADLALSNDGENEEKAGDSFRSSSGNSSEQYITASSINHGSSANSTGLQENFSEVHMPREVDMEADENRNAEGLPEKEANEFGDLPQQCTFKSPVDQSMLRDPNILRPPSHTQSAQSGSSKNSARQSSPLQVTTCLKSEAEKATMGPFAHVKDEEWRRKLLTWPTYKHKMVSRRQEIDDVYFGRTGPRVCDFTSSSHDLFAGYEDCSNSTESVPLQEQRLEMPTADSGESELGASNPEHFSMDTMDTEMHYPNAFSHVQQADETENGVLDGDTPSSFEPPKTNSMCLATEKFGDSGNLPAVAESTEIAASSQKRKERKRKSKTKKKKHSETADRKKKKKEKSRKRQEKTDVNVEGLKMTEKGDKHADNNTDNRHKHAGKNTESVCEVGQQLQEDGPESEMRKSEALASADKALSPSNKHSENHSSADASQPHLEFSAQPVLDSKASMIPLSSAAPALVTDCLSVCQGASTSEADGVIDSTVCNENKGDKDPGEVASDSESDISIHTDDTDADDLSPRKLQPFNSRLNLFSLQPSLHSISESVESTPTEDECSEAELDKAVGVAAGEGGLPQTGSASELVPGIASSKSVETGSCGIAETPGEHPSLSSLPNSDTPGQNALQAWPRELPENQNLATVFCHPADGKSTSNGISEKENANSTFDERRLMVDSVSGTTAFLSAEQKLQSWDGDTVLDSPDRPIIPFVSSQLQVTPTKDGCGVNTPGTAQEGLFSKQAGTSAAKLTVAKTLLYSPSLIWSPDKTSSNWPSFQDSMSSHSFNRFVGLSSGGSSGDCGVPNVGPTLGLIDDESARDASSVAPEFVHSDGHGVALTSAQNTSEDVQSQVSLSMRLKARDALTEPSRSGQVLKPDEGSRRGGSEAMDEEADSCVVGNEQQKQASQNPPEPDSNTPLFGFPSFTSLRREGTKLSFQYKRTPNFLASSSSSGSVSSTTASSSSSSTSVLSLSSSSSSTTVPTEQPTPPSVLPVSSLRPTKRLETVREEELGHEVDSVGFDVANSSREIGTGLSPAVSPGHSSLLSSASTRVAAAEEAGQLVAAESDARGTDREKGAGGCKSGAAESGSSLGDESENPQVSAKASTLGSDGLLVESAAAVPSEPMPHESREDLEEGEIESSDAVSKSSSTSDNPKVSTGSLFNTVEQSLEEGEIITSDGFPSSGGAHMIGVTQLSPPQVLECAVGENAQFTDLRKLLQHKRHKAVNKSRGLRSELTQEPLKRNRKKAGSLPSDNKSLSRRESHIPDSSLPAQEKRKASLDAGKPKRTRLSDTGDGAKEATSVADKEAAVQAELRRERQRARQDKVRQGIIGQLTPSDLSPSRNIPAPGLKSYKIPKVGKAAAAKEQAELARANSTEDRDGASLRTSRRKRKASGDSPEPSTSSRICTSIPVPSSQTTPYADSTSKNLRHRSTLGGSKQSHHNSVSLQQDARPHPAQTSPPSASVFGDEDGLCDSRNEDARENEEVVADPQGAAEHAPDGSRRSCDSSMGLQQGARMPAGQTLAPFTDALEGMDLLDDAKPKEVQDCQEDTAECDTGSSSSIPDLQGSCRTRLFHYVRDPTKPKPEIDELEEEDNESSEDEEPQNEKDSGNFSDSGDLEDDNNHADWEQSSENESGGEEDESDGMEGTEGEADEEDGGVDREDPNQFQGECGEETSARMDDSPKQQIQPESKNGGGFDSDDSSSLDDGGNACNENGGHTNHVEHSGSTTKTRLTPLARHRTSNENQQLFSHTQTTNSSKTVSGQGSATDSEEETSSRKGSCSDHSGEESSSDASDQESATNSENSDSDSLETVTSKVPETVSAGKGGDTSGHNQDKPELTSSNKYLSEGEIFDSSDDEQLLSSEQSQVEQGQNSETAPSENHSALNVQVSKESSLDCLSLDAFANGEGHSLLELCDTSVNENGHTEPVKLSAECDRSMKVGDGKRKEWKLKHGSPPVSLAGGTLKPPEASAGARLDEVGEKEAAAGSINACLLKMNKSAKEHKCERPERNRSRSDNDSKEYHSRCKNQDTSEKKDHAESRARSTLHSKSNGPGPSSTIGARSTEAKTSRPRIYSSDSKHRSTLSCSSKENWESTRGHYRSPETHGRSSERCSKTCDHSRRHTSPTSHSSANKSGTIHSKSSEDSGSGKNQKTSSGRSASCKCCQKRPPSPQRRSLPPQNQSGGVGGLRDKHTTTHSSPGRQNSQSQEREWKHLGDRCNKHHRSKSHSRSPQRERQRSQGECDRHHRSRTRSREGERKHPDYTHGNDDRRRSMHETEKGREQRNKSHSPKREECSCDRCWHEHSGSCDCGRCRRDNRRRSRSRSPLRCHIKHCGCKENLHRRDRHQPPKTAAMWRRKGYR